MTKTLRHHMLRSCPSQLLVPRNRKAEHTEKAIRLVLEEKNQLGVLSSINKCLEIYLLLWQTINS